MPIIEETVKHRPSYGYRRVTALLNKTLKTQGTSRVNHKCVYRVMKQNHLLLPSYDKKPSCNHDGKVITLSSNTRWCTDTFTVQCFNGDRLHVAFAMDTCDREIIGFIASTIGIDGATIRDLILESVEYRFGPIQKLSHPIQWLSDNGSCYTARETIKFARELGFDVRTTPAYSPESNGMAEAFVKTFKRDYISLCEPTDAITLMNHLPEWFENYNENAPHKGLKMRSPREFIRVANGGSVVRFLGGYPNKQHECSKNINWFEHQGRSSKSNR